MEERTGTGGGHKIMISNRKSGVLNGVIDVLSFDVGEILLETELGMLMIKGNDLHGKRRDRYRRKNRQLYLFGCKVCLKTNGIFLGKTL